MMPDTEKLTFAEAERRLNMNLSLVEMLRGNTDPEDIARFRALWVEPIQEIVRSLKAG